MIAVEYFAKGFFVFSFGLTPDTEAVDGHISLPFREECDLRHGYKTATRTCILHVEFPGLFEIYKSRNVRVD